MGASAPESADEEFRRAAAMKRAQTAKMAKSENESAALDTQELCSCYVPRETSPIQVIETHGFSSKSTGSDPFRRRHN